MYANFTVFDLWNTFEVTFAFLGATIVPFQIWRVFFIHLPSTRKYCSCCKINDGSSVYTFKKEDKLSPSPIAFWQRLRFPNFHRVDSKKTWGSRSLRQMTTKRTSRMLAYTRCGPHESACVRAFGSAEAQTETKDYTTWLSQQQTWTMRVRVHVHACRGEGRWEWRNWQRKRERKREREEKKRDRTTTEYPPRVNQFREHRACVYG